MFKIDASDWVFQKQSWISREGVLGSRPGQGKKLGKDGTQLWSSLSLIPQDLLDGE